MSEPSSVPPATPHPSKTKNTASRTPAWLRSVLGVFGIYVIAVIILEIVNMPSGTVQRNQPQSEEHTHIDPSIIQTISDLEKMTVAQPGNADLMLQFANALHDAKFFPRAVESYTKYLAMAPANADARVDLGICYFELGNIDRAVKEIESVIQANPKHQMAMFNLGVIQLSNQNMAESAKWLRKCIEIDPQSTAGQRAQQILQQHQ